MAVWLEDRLQEVGGPVDIPNPTVDQDRIGRVVVLAETTDMEVLRKGVPRAGAARIIKMDVPKLFVHHISRPAESLIPTEHVTERGNLGFVVPEIGCEFRGACVAKYSPK
ncbi:hypothetical protein D9M70_540650 [compost metagenome]